MQNGFHQQFTVLHCVLNTMGKASKINKKLLGNLEAQPIEMSQNSHLEGLTQDEIHMVELISEIIVKAIVNERRI